MRATMQPVIKFSAPLPWAMRRGRRPVIKGTATLTPNDSFSFCFCLLGLQFFNSSKVVRIFGHVLFVLPQLPIHDAPRSQAIVAYAEPLETSSRDIVAVRANAASVLIATFHAPKLKLFIYKIYTSLTTERWNVFAATERKAKYLNICGSDPLRLGTCT